MTRALLAAAVGTVAAVLLWRGALCAQRDPAMRGACYATWSSEDVLASRWSDGRLAELRDLGVNWMGVRVTWVQEAYNSTRIQPGFPTQSDEAYAHAVAQCHKLGMKVMLALIVDFKDPMRGGSYRWRGQIDPSPNEGVNGRTGERVNAAQQSGSPSPLHPFTPSSPWEQWLRSYERFALTYAKLAQEWGVDLFCIGAEMTSATNKFEQPWREIVRKTREVYKGPVTYQANWSPLECAFGGARGADLLRRNQWNAEYKTVKFWDALDCASMCAYFSLSDKPNPTLEELEANLAVWREDVRAWQKTVGKPVVFTEVGYQSADGAATEPWLTPLATPANPDLQARCYEAFFRAFYKEPWVKGIFWWMACPPDEQGVDKGGLGYPFLGKPAEDVVRRWYRE